MAKRCLYWYLGLSLSLTALSGCGHRAFHIELVPTNRSLRETLVQKDEGLFVSDKIAVIDMDGLMINRRKGGLLRTGENPVSLFLEKLDKAADDPGVKAVVLRLNSPGGTVAASDIMHHRLLEFKRTTSKPVIACVVGLGCSGAYYLACGSDGIMTQPSAVTGNIGTIFQTFSVAGTMEKIGIKTVAIKSGKLKDMASPLHDLSDDERQVLEGIIEDLYQQFLAVVGQGRPGLSEQKIRELADGRVFTAKQALNEGLIDRIGYLSGAIEWAKEMADVDRAKVVIYHRSSSYKPNAYGSAAAHMEGLGPLINIDLPDWLTSGESQFLYLWQPAVH
ncbi:MAG: signal peptide peptidase SppA [Planctomycetota bacterium]|jgi:protease-4